MATLLAWLFAIGTILIAMDRDYLIETTSAFEMVVVCTSMFFIGCGLICAAITDAANKLKQEN